MEDLSKVKVMVENLSEGTVGYKDENRRAKRRWNSVGQKLLIPADELQEVLYDDSIKRLFTLGYLGIANKEHRVLIGLDIEGYQTVVPFSTKEASDLLALNTTETIFRSRIKALQGNAKDVVAKVAATTDSLSQMKMKVIKEELGIDILSIMNNQQ